MDDMLEQTPPDAGPSVAQIMADLAASEADEAAGRIEDGSALLAALDRAAGDIQAKAACRRA